MALHGDWSTESFGSDEDVDRWLAENGSPFSIATLAQRCTDASQRVPFQNLIGSTWTIEMEGGEVRWSTVDPSGHVEEGLSESGVGSTALYWSLFETSVAARDRAVATRSYGELQSAFAIGMGSIEAYISAKARLWNRLNPGAPPLDDSKNAKVPFDNKVKQWIPAMTTKRFDMGNQTWQDFTAIRAIRDDMTIHPKTAGFAVALSQFAAHVNLYREGIAGFLVELHLLFGDKIPSAITIARYSPDVVIADADSTGVP